MCARNAREGDRKIDAAWCVERSSLHFSIIQPCEISMRGETRVGNGSAVASLANIELVVNVCI